MNLFTVHLNETCVGIVPKILKNDKPLFLDQFVEDLFNNMGYQSDLEYLGDLPGRSNSEELFISHSNSNPECTYFFGGQTPYTSNKLFITFNSVMAMRLVNDPVTGFVHCNMTSSLPDLVDPYKNGGENCMFLAQPRKGLCNGIGAKFNYDLWFCSDWTEEEEQFKPKPIPHKSIYSNYKIQMNYDPNPNTSREYVTNMVIGLVGFFSPIVWSIVFRLLR